MVGCRRGIASAAMEVLTEQPPQETLPEQPDRQDTIPGAASAAVKEDALAPSPPLASTSLSAFAGE